MDRSDITIETYNKSAIRYQEKFMEMNLYDDTYNDFCKLIDKGNQEILEIATGPGNVTRRLLKKYPDFKITGIDKAPNMVRLAKNGIPNADFHVMDCRDISRLKDKYDAIMCGFCMPYLSKDECAKLIQDMSGLLNSNGLIYISTMEDDYSKSGFETTSFSGNDKVYIYYHQYDFLKKELTESGFQNIDIQRKEHPEPDGAFLTDMIIMARK
ncbi:MAG: class I SAM-dependent methyltransferase [Cyclobacteriaceae bacterium]|nr:class I SAM-dependent methyltransferase [Cyclobacteriaceae bacterium]